MLSLSGIFSGQHWSGIARIYVTVAWDLCLQKCDKFLCWWSDTSRSLIASTFTISSATNGHRVSAGFTTATRCYAALCNVYVLVLSIKKFNSVMENTVYYMYNACYYGRQILPHCIYSTQPYQIIYILYTHVFAVVRQFRITVVFLKKSKCDPSRRL